VNNTTKMQNHFERVASVYPNVRNTDTYIIEEIILNLPHHNRPVDIIDIGSGTGRYSELIAIHLDRSNPRIFCGDYSGAMIAKCCERMSQGFLSGNINCCRVNANGLPFRDCCFDAIVTFNAVHHFDLDHFVAESVRILRTGGLLAIYTRTPEQNMRTVWGQYFPRFTERETRLCRSERLEQAIGSISELELKSIKTFTHMRVESPESLLSRARNFHYSTFALYPQDEFKQAMGTFAQRLTDPGTNGVIEHTAENTLILARCK